MTRGETISILEESKRQNEIMRDNPSTFWASHQMAEGIKNAKRRIEAFEIALTALRPVSREQVERMRGEWIAVGAITCKCSRCQHSELSTRANEYLYCPACGAPMTDEAVDIVMERLEALHESP